MKNNLQKRLKGYISHPRERFWLLKSRTLTPIEFMVYEFYLSIADWDRRHKSTHGTFVASNEEVAVQLGYKSDSSISRIRSKLLAKKLIEYLPEIERYKIINFELWTSTLPAKVQEEIAKLETEYAEMQNRSANLQENRFKSVSFREDVDLFNTTFKNDTRSIDQLNPSELFILSKHLFGEGTKVICGKEVWE